MNDFNKQLTEKKNEKAEINDEIKKVQLDCQNLVNKKNIMLFPKIIDALIFFHQKIMLILVSTKIIY